MRDPAVAVEASKAMLSPTFGPVGVMENSGSSSVFGAVMTSKVAGIDEGLLNSPEAIAALPAGQRVAVIDALASGVHAVFVVAIPLVCIAAVISWFLKEVPLRTTFGEAPTDEEEALREEAVMQAAHI